MKRRVVLSLVLLTLLSILAPIIGNTTRAAAIPSPLGDRPGHEQFGLVGSGSIAVWEDRAVAANPATESVRGTSDIRGFDFATNRALVVSAAPGDQVAPAISGSVVVWQDSQHSCPTCEADIRGKDLSTGTEFAVATGPSDQSGPAIARKIVVWIETDASGQRIRGVDLASQAALEIAAASPGTTLSRPAISDEFVVWSEISGQSLHTLRAYNLKTSTVSLVTESTWPGLQYAVSGHTIIWTNPQVNISDLVTGTSSILDPGPASSPQIAGTTAIWSGTELGETNGFEIFGIDLATGKGGRLAVAPGNQQGAVVVDHRLLWQSDEAGRVQVFSTPLDAAFAAASPLPQTRETQQAQETSAVAGDVSPANHDTNYTRPTYKGMHTANGGGWNVTYNGTQQPCHSSGCPAVDSLGAPFAPFFGSFVVLEYDLGRSTGRSAPWGPTVADAMKYVQNTYGSRVITRTYPSLAPNPSGTTTPSNVAGKVIALAQARDWHRHVQVDNEPNLDGGFPASCTGCKWVTDGQTKTYTWTSRHDYRMYQAINDFFGDTWWVINYYKGNHSDPTVRARLQQMEIWAPPMSDIYRNLDNGQNFYAYLHGMIDLYDRMTYHTYPAPRFDSDGSGGVISNSWNWFDSWLQTNINNGSVRSMITEFGWNPGAMPPCGMTQYSTWPSTGSCAANDGYTHTFDNDLSRFLAYHRHNAEVVAVWIMKGWDDRADGLDQYGNVRTWLHNYQWSNP